MLDEERKVLTKQPIVWTGDLSDDCIALWAGLMLRAECMDEHEWWWAVYDMQNNEIIIDASNEYDTRFTDGEIARKQAEKVAKKYFGC